MLLVLSPYQPRVILYVAKEPPIWEIYSIYLKFVIDGTIYFLSFDMYDTRYAATFIRNGEFNVWVLGGGGVQMPQVLNCRDRKISYLSVD